MSQRLTRKEIKRNVLADWVAQVLDLLRGHRRGLVLTVGGVAGVCIVAAALIVGWRTRQTEANDLLARAILVAGAPADVSEAEAKPDDPDEPSFGSEEARRARAVALLEQVEGQSWTGAAVVARAYLGRLAQEQGQPEEARRYWESFLEDAEGHFLAGEVRLNLLKLDREEGELADVAAKLREMLAASEKGLPGDVLLFELGITLEEMGEAEEASETFQRLIDEYPRSAYRAEAQQRTAGSVTAGLGLPGLGG